MFKLKKITLTSLIILIAVSLSLSTFFWITPTDSKVQSYNSGDAISYNGQLIVGTTDTGKLELFSVQNEVLVRRSIIEQQTVKWKKLYGVALAEENSRLYAYTTNGRYLIKYDITDLDGSVLIKRAQDNSGDWFLQVKKTGDQIMTVGEKENKIWNADLQVIDAYQNSFRKNTSRNTSLSFDGKWFFEVQTNFLDNDEDDFIRITDGNSHREVLKQQIVLSDIKDHKVYYDSVRQLAYINGDCVLKQINLNTLEVKNFQHMSEVGYDVDGFGKNYFYFSDGLGVVKMSHDLKLLDSIFAYQLGLPNSWSMGMKVLEHNGQDRIVVFNHTSIIVLDENLDLVAKYFSIEEDAPTNNALEKLSLRLNKTSAEPGENIVLSGIGFGFNENLKIEFIHNSNVISRQSIKSNSNGSFLAALQVPDRIYPGEKRYPIPVAVKVTGEASESTYSISFYIK